MESNDYLAKNRQSWNNRVDTHIRSDFYGNEAFLQGKSSLKSLELDLLGKIAGKSVLHLQCHFGQDSISLARMGASVTAMDLSDRAIEKGREFSQTTGTDVEFICCDVYDLPNHLDKRFDIVFTTYGTIGWLPDLDKWAGVIAHFLKPGGRLVFVEFHPVVWMFDDDFDHVAYRYLGGKAIAEQVKGTYADPGANIALETVSWNHGLGEVFTALLSHGLSITAFQEFDYSPYDCFRHTEEVGQGKFRIKHLQDKIPMIYALEATKS